MSVKASATFGESSLQISQLNYAYTQKKYILITKT